MAQIEIKDAYGNNKTIDINLNGRAYANSSAPMVLSTEDYQALDDLLTTATDIQTKISVLPPTIGQQTMANSLSVVVASNQGNLQVNVVSSALPSGAAQANLQTDMIVLLANTVSELQTVNVNLEANVAALPHQPLDATSDLTYVHVSRTSNGESNAVTATSGQTTRVHMIYITCNAAVTVELLDGAGGSSLRKWNMPAAGEFYSGFCERPLAKTTANTVLVVKTNANCAVDVGIDYIKSA